MSAPEKPPRLRPDLSLEQALLRADPTTDPICGVDEAGRGPWAGPVCAAAVILDPARLPPVLDDSKRLSPKRREAAFAQIMELAEVGVAFASVAEIDSLGIVPANDLAMTRALAALPRRPGHALIDGLRCPPEFEVPATALVKGDARSLSIAAASIIAKVTRDREMARLADLHPGYGWETNMGYGAARHAEGLKALGVTQHHRQSFAPIRKILGERIKSTS